VPTFVNFNTFDPSVTACGDAVQICSLWCGRLQVLLNGMDSNPLFTLETSIDGAVWDSYDECSNAELSNGVNMFRIDKTDALYFRICIDANGNTTGTNTENKMLLKAIR